MNKKLKITIPFIFIFSILCSISSASALSDEEFSEKYSSTAERLSLITSPSVGSVGGEWTVLGLSRAGLISEETKNAYYGNVESYVKNAGSNQLHRRKSTDNSRVVIALSAIGKDPRNVCGYDLTAPLEDFDYVKKQGINGVIWALIALDTCGYGSSSSRDVMISAILDSQHSDGGWGLDSEISDPDMTSMALLALSPYGCFDEAVRTASDNGVALLASLQRESGGYYSYDDFNPESCAQVITALSVLGIDPESDERFCKGGKTLFDSLMQFSGEGGFAHTIGNGYNQMSTEQAFYAMTAFKRLQNNDKALFDMTDVQSYKVLDLNGDGSQSILDATYIQQYLAEFDVTFTTAQKKLADINGNGRIDVGDVTEFQRILAS